MSRIIEVCESIHGTWHYHLRERGKTESICGATVMHCGIPLSQWYRKLEGHHIPESFCKKCEDERARRQIELGL